MIEKFPILDPKNAIGGLGNEDLYINMIDEFQDTIIEESLLMLKIAINDFDYMGIKSHARSLKGSSSYIYAERVKYISEKMETTVERNVSEVVLEHYPCLIKECIILKRAIRKQIAETQGYL